MDRRNFLALSGAALVGSGVRPSAQEGASQTPGAGTVSPANNVKRDRPNILLLMADQWRVDCTGVYGNKVVRTPNPDRLGNGRLVAHLEERGNAWVRNGKLIPRPQGMMLSPNFPGYEPPRMSER